MNITNSHPKLFAVDPSMQLDDTLEEYVGSCIINWFYFRWFGFLELRC